MAIASIEAFNRAQQGDERAVCTILQDIIHQGLPDAESRIWHAHPVWFLADNPIVGYSKLKDCIRLMFWSGQSFRSRGLDATGSFKAAERRFTSPAEIDRGEVMTWLEEARIIQWDYKNIQKRKGRLERLL